MGNLTNVQTRRLSPIIFVRLRRLKSLVQLKNAIDHSHIT